MHDFTEKEYHAILTTKRKFTIPKISGIKKGVRGLQIWAKVNGDMTLVSVIVASEPVKREDGITYVVVFGAGVRRREIDVQELLKPKKR